MNIIPLRVALAQVNTTVGDLVGNTRKIIDSMQQAYAAGAHMVWLIVTTISIMLRQLSMRGN